MSKKLKILFVVFSMCFLTSTVLADTINVVNPSFELPGTGTEETDWSLIDGWSCAANRNTGVQNKALYSAVEVTGTPFTGAMKVQTRYIS